MNPCSSGHTYIPSGSELFFKIAIEPVVQKTLKLRKDVHTNIFLVHVDDNDLVFSRSARRAACSGPRLAQLAAGSNVCFNMKSTQISRAPTDVRDGRSHELCMPLDPFVLTFCIVGRRPRCTSPDARPSAVFWNYCTRPAKSRYENSIEVHGVNARNRWQDPSPASMPCDEKYDSDAPASCARAHI